MTKEGIELTEWNRKTIGFAIRDLGEAFSTGGRTDSSADFVRCVKKAKRNIDEFLNEIYPIGELSAKEASLARCLHTYSRKYMDSLFSCFIWQAIDTGFGQRVWFAFIKACVGNGFKAQGAFDIARGTYGCDDFESYAMLAILEQWIEYQDMQGAIDDIIKNGGIEV